MDSKARCAWVPRDKPDYIAYHDTEWGVPVHDDRKLFEMLILEGAQAGLSWYTILRRRDGYRRAFRNFDVRRVARLTDSQLEKILSEGDVVRNRLKVFGTRRNAIAFLAIQREFGSFDRYVWEFVGGKQVVNLPRGPKDFRSTSPESDALSKDLRKRGMTFVGTTIIYAFMQAVGIVNDHAAMCFRAPRAPRSRRVLGRAKKLRT